MKITSMTPHVHRKTCRIDTMVDKWWVTGDSPLLNSTIIICLIMFKSYFIKTTLKFLRMD